MKKFIFLTYGFEKPTPAIMQAWGKWFEKIKDSIVEKGHFPRGREISKSGVRELTLTPDAITGYVVVEAESFEAASKMAETNPYVSSIRIYELTQG